MLLKLMLSLIISFAFSTLMGLWYIPWLRSQHAGQSIKKIGPIWHMGKEGTPTMGGFLFIGGTLLSCITVGFPSIVTGNSLHLFIFLFALSFGAIGFLDDWEKLKHKENLGLSAKMKFALQLVSAFIFLFLLKKMQFINPNVYIPFFNTYIYISEWLYYLISIIVIVGTVNAVNITDGVDGLATGSALPVLLFFVVLAFRLGDGCLEQGIFASALVGGLMGFLVYNFNPAKVFMGDTGSLFIGGAIVALAFVYDIPLILIVLCIVFVVETLSDIIQVCYFKLSGGKRVFRMAPLHHHLEMGGFTGHKWKEKELFVLFTSISLIFAVLSLIGVSGKFNL